MKADIVNITERLNDDENYVDAIDDAINALEEQAEEIATLRAENERLRAALKPFANYAACIMPEFDDDMWRDCAFSCGDFRKAAALLTPAPGGAND